MTKTKYYCDKCEKEITDFNEAKEYKVRWEDKYCDYSIKILKILLCKDCAMDFHKNVLRCEYEMV